MQSLRQTFKLSLFLPAYVCAGLFTPLWYRWSVLASLECLWNARLVTLTTVRAVLAHLRDEFLLRSLSDAWGLGCPALAHQVAQTVATVV